MIHNYFLHTALWIIIALLVLLAAGIGVGTPDVYHGVVPQALLPGAFSQDVISIGAAILLLILSVRISQNSVRKPLIVWGLLGYFFYAYGIYVIEQTYNMLYLLYVTIFTLSFWSLTTSIASIDSKYIHAAGLSTGMRYLSIAGLLLSPTIFIPLWVFALVPLMQTGNRIESLFSVYILDLCFIMPAFVILAGLLIKKHGLGILLTPALFVLGFTLIFSLAVGELIKPLYHLSIETGGLVQSLGLSFFFLILGMIHLAHMHIKQV